MNTRSGFRFVIRLVLPLVLFALGRQGSAFVVINEIMYHPPKGSGDCEFIELINDGPTTREIGGWRFTNGIDFTFPEGTSIPAGGYLVVCANPNAIRQAYKIENVTGPYRGKLDNAGETLELRNGAGGLIDRVDYKDDPPWPAGADGTGHSLALVDSLAENQRARSWRISNEPGGTPGRGNFPDGPRPPSVLINEVLCESGDQTWVELYNHTTATIDLSGYLLSDEADVPAKFVVPKGTRIAAGGFRVFTEKDLGFTLTPKRRKIFLRAPRARFVVDATAYGKAAPGQSVGRWPDGADAWYRMTRPTPGAPDTVTLNTDIVINEIMYHPFSERDEDEYVELYNRGDSPVDLTGWAFTKGIEFEFPSGTVLQPGGYLVVAKDHRSIMDTYGIKACIGDYKKQLNNDRDRLVLRDALGNIADEVTYYDGGRWPEWADGGGSSLELIDPRQNNAYPSAWAASDETGKARWTYFEYSKRNRKGRSEFQMFLVDDGIALVDDIRLRKGDKDFLTSGTFDLNTHGWKIGGTHKHSTRWTKDSHGGGACLRVVAVGRGDTGVNCIKIDTAETLKSTETYTVSYWARWQAGNNRLCTRTHGNGVAMTQALPVPKTLGTPGRRNSRYRRNIGPIITDVRHAPVTPTSGTAVTVRARILDADGVATATVYSRPDGRTTWTATAMGRGEARSDGLFGALLPPQPGATLVEFYIEAADRRGAVRRFPAGAPRRTALYRVCAKARPSGRLKTFDLLLNTRTRDKLVRRALSEARMDNEFLDATIVLNDTRAFYNVGVRFGGSPWLRPLRKGKVLLLSAQGRRPSYRIRFNSDEKLFGLKSVNFDSQNVDSTRLHERMFYWLVERLGGVPFGAREFVAMHQNGYLKGVYELVQRIDRRFLEDYFPKGDDGDLYKVDTAYEWEGRRFTFERTRIQYRGSDKENYRFHFQKRSNEKADDFSSIIELCRLFDKDKTDDMHFNAGVEEALDLDEWLRSLACQAVAADWDGFGFRTGKNARLYRRSDTGRWVLLPYDKDLTWGNTNLPAVYRQAPGVSRLLGLPAVKRLYFFYIEQLLDGPFTRNAVDPRLDGYHAVLRAGGDNAIDPRPLKNFVDRRTQWLRKNVLPKPAPFEITTRGGDDFSTASPAIALEGTAPLSVRTIELNGRAAGIEWTDVTTWRIEHLALKPGVNRIRLAARPMPEGKKATAEIAITRE